MIQNDDIQNSDELGALWQQQPNIEVDTNNIIKQAKSQRTKQRIYIFVDFFSIAVAWGLLFLDLSLNNFMKVFIVLNALITTVLFIFIIKLRWVSIFHTNSATINYQLRLRKQLHNNARIAFYNKHSTWLAWIFVTILISVNFYIEGLSQTIFLEQISLLALIGLVFLLPYYIWAHKRQLRFEKEIASLIAEMGSK